MVVVVAEAAAAAEIGWKEHPQNDLFCVEWDSKH